MVVRYVHDDTNVCTMNKRIKDLTNSLRDHHSVDFSLFDRNFLMKIIHNRSAKLNHIFVDDYLDYLELEKEEVQLLYNSLNINYSSFFRDSITFSYLEKKVLPSLIQSKLRSGEKVIKVWSAACAAGQEAYSVAMLLDELLQNESVDYNIIATDNNADILKKNGIYTRADVSNVTYDRIENYFNKKGNHYQINDTLKSKVSFTEFNLLDNPQHLTLKSIEKSFDIVLCSNVLFYYRDKQKRKIIKHIIKSTSQHGVIITGEVERDDLISQGLIELFEYSSIFVNPV